MTRTDAPYPAATAPANGAARGFVPRARPYLLIALAAGIGLHLLALALVRPLPVPVSLTQAPRAFVTLADPAAVRAQAELYDPEPLLLPTPRNFASREPAGQLVKPPAVFGPFTLDIAPEESAFGLAAQDADQARPLLALAPGRWDVIRSVGQAAAPQDPLPRRGARVYVVRLGAGLSADAPDAAIGPTFAEETWPVEAFSGLPSAVAGAMWRPAVFVMLFGRAGPVGLPLLTRTTGVDVIDARLRELIEERFRRQPLPPGSYEITVGP